MEVVLAYNPFSYGKSDSSSIKTEILGAADLSKRPKRAKPNNAAAAQEYCSAPSSNSCTEPTYPGSVVPILAYSSSATSSSQHEQQTAASTSGNGLNSASNGLGINIGHLGTLHNHQSHSSSNGLNPGSDGILPHSNVVIGTNSSHKGHPLHHPLHHDSSAGSGGGLFSSGAAAAAASILRFNVGVGSSAFLHPTSKHGSPKRGMSTVLLDMTAMCKRLWLLAWPLSWMEVLTFMKELVITSYVGHLGAAELSALVLAQTVYNVTGNAPMLGVVTAMETFCGQAFGARRYGLVGVVLQRGLAISFLYCCSALVIWQWCEALLVYMGQDVRIAAAASRFTLALAPALFMDAADQCCRRYLSAQAVVQPLMFATLLATLLTPVFLWLFVAKWGLGLIGAAVAWDAVQATSLTLMVTYCIIHTRSQEPSRCTWTGWTREALKDWALYIRMAIPSCVMICLDWWTFEVIVMLSGLLTNPEQTMSMMGITFNIHALCFFAAHGLSGAASTRVGNDLGAGRPHMAWLTVQVAVLMGTLVMVVSSVLLLMSRNSLGKLFSSEADVVQLTAQAVPPLAVSLIGEGANTVLAGVMRGCGRQKIGAAINLVTYWVFGLPIACLLAFPGKLGALGLWTGLACTASVQALLMTITVFR
eukprot:GHRR01034459.1.p1 GENE.GHRR01034459.1~~GHRR01034459.1.p1  ORF type:complete len:646 (+),score=178.69 GHRR01034459.1:333-2270(+)